MPYIALQLVGISAVLKSMGFAARAGRRAAAAHRLPRAGALHVQLRAAGAGADRVRQGRLIYLTIIVAVIVIPSKLGGWDHIFGAAQAKFAADRRPGCSCRRPASSGYATLALGSALALFLYPHSVTGVLAASNRDVLKRNMSALPVYSLALGLIALLGYMAIAAGTKPIGTRRQHDRPAAVPADVPELVHRHRLRRHRHRRAGARGDHVDRRGEPVHPQHLQGVPEAGRHPGRRRRSPRSPRWWSSSARSRRSSSSTRSSPSTCS